MPAPPPISYFFFFFFFVFPTPRPVTAPTRWMMAPQTKWTAIPFSSSRNFPRERKKNINCEKNNFGNGLIRMTRVLPTQQTLTADLKCLSIPSWIRYSVFSLFFPPFCPSNLHGAVNIEERKEEIFSRSLLPTRQTKGLGKDHLPGGGIGRSRARHLLNDCQANVGGFLLQSRKGKSDRYTTVLGGGSPGNSAFT